MLEALRTNNMMKCSSSYQSVQSELADCQGVLLRGDRIVVPVELRKRALELAHEGHQGIVKTKQRLRSKVWWPGIDSDCEKLCKSCVECMRVSAPEPPAAVTMTKFPSKPWDYLSADLLGPLPNGQYIFVVIDYHSRFFEAAFMKTITADKIIDFLDVTFTRYGLCSALRTDNGPQFVAREFQEFLAENGVRWVSTTPLWPQANGEVERVNRTLLKSLKIAHGKGLPLHKELRKFLVAYRSTPHSTTGVAPFTLMFGRSMKTKLPAVDSDVGLQQLQQEAADRDSLVKTRAKQQVDDKLLGRKADDIMVGDQVLLQQRLTNKLDSTYSDKPHTVVAKQGTDIVCDDGNGGIVRRNVSFAKRYPPHDSAGEGTGSMGDVPGGSSVGDQFPRRSPRQSCLPQRYGNYRVH